MAGIGNATKFGILVREGDALERLSKVTKIAFDKTGTLTYGKPTVIAVQSFNADICSEKLLEIAASAELRSEHPLGKAVVTHFRTTSHLTLLEPQAFTMIPGSGVKATIAENTVLAGNSDLLVENSIQISEAMMKKAGEYKNDGCTVIYIAVNSQEAGFIALSDTLRVR